MTDLSQAAADAHQLRAMYEKYSFVIVPTVVVIVIFAAVVAALWPTPYGQMVVTRLISLKDMIMDLLGVLLAGTIGTMARGHADQWIKQNQPPPQQ